jgi:dolichyl-diphosphooligosaccharide--protein glycosyltransferase/undecaprenyl-diphosphooligosaccharide--protein glycosyltransferase
MNNSNSADTSHFKLTYFFMLVLFAYTFSIVIRLIWVYQFQDNPDFYWNDHLMINTNDGYAYAEGARDMLAGFHQDNDLSYYGTALSSLTYLLAKILPFSFETIILYMPAFFGSLLIVPIMLIARVLKQDLLGFIAALLAGIVWSYYNRTMTGYYDTDMLTIVLPSFVLYSIILNIQEERNRFLLLIPIFIIAYSWWYGQSYSLNIAMAFMVFFYTLVFEREKLFNYKILIFMFIAMSYFAWEYKLIASFALFFVFHFVEKANSKKVIFALLFIAFAIILFTGGLNPILYQIKGYIFREAVAGELDLNFHFFGVTQTVREAGQIPFEIFANRISGHTLTFFLSLIGYVLLSLRYRVMWLALPMLGLGFLAYKGGLRFTVYAVPVMALGMAYFILWSSKYLDALIPKDRTLLITKRAYITLFTLAVLYPNIIHVINYKVPTVFTKQEVEILDKLHKISDREDYVVTWWDYGYPIRYYSDIKTLIDGGKHTGKDNFPVSFALTNTSVAGANMARLDVEYTERSFKEKFSSNLSKEMQDYNYTDVNKFLSTLFSTSFVPPKPTRDIYFYLPMRMLNIFPTVALFSNIDILSGKQLNRPFFYSTSAFKDAGAVIHLGNGIALDKKKGIVKLGQQEVPLAQFITVGYDSNGKLQKRVQNIQMRGQLSLIYMRSYNQFLLLDNRMLNSLYIQLFVLENYDKDIFELVINSPHAKVYKLKR